MIWNRALNRLLNQQLNLRPYLYLYRYLHLNLQLYQRPVEVWAQSSAGSARSTHSMYPSRAGAPVYRAMHRVRVVMR